ncbi:MAG: cytochrome c [Betaproteobacteria bacterium]|nr:cytochrome c [Betaproteobacteria bacterium]
MIRARPLLVASFTLACALPLAAPGADAERGRALYEQRCDSCHAESVHGRAKREASGFESLRGWVRRWSGNLGLKWSTEEIDDVALYLNGRYYRFACPPATCPKTGRSDGAPQFTATGPSGAS